jgi:hypothetical protein
LANAAPQQRLPDALSDERHGEMANSLEHVTVNIAPAIGEALRRWCNAGKANQLMAVTHGVKERKHRVLPARDQRDELHTSANDKPRCNQDFALVFHNVDPHRMEVNFNMFNKRGMSAKVRQPCGSFSFFGVFVSTFS